ncbi:MAG: DUF418 domain-containing protein [Bacteroidota bacterium]
MNQRVEELDVIRGYAIFGILVCNIVLFHYPLAYFTSFFSQYKDWIDQFATYLRFNFFADKTFSVFSLLFGVGIGMQYVKKQAQFYKYHLARMVILLVIGLIHAFVIWYGDILSMYAVLGLVAALFMRLSVLQLLIFALLLFIWPTIQTILIRNGYLQIGFGTSPPLPLDELIAMNTSQGFSGHWQYNVKQILSVINFYLTGNMYHSFSMIVAGIAIAKSGFLSTLSQHTRKLYLMLIITGLVVLIWNAYQIFFFDLSKMNSPIQFYSYWVLFNLTIVGQTFFICCALVLMVRSKHKWLQNIRVLRHLGRLSLTNYILHSILGLIIFKVLGFYGQSTPAVDMLLAVLLTVIQLIFSKAWLAKYRIGPLEGIWRWATKRITISPK